MNDPTSPQKPSAAAGAVVDAAADFRVIAIEGGIWACAPVSERPEVTLTDWRVYEVPLPGNPEPTRHFVGYNTAEREGRVSSPIMQFDAATRRGVTESGRVYELRGKPGWSGDADYTWKRWKRINEVTDAFDVTGEINS